MYNLKVSFVEPDRAMIRPGDGEYNRVPGGAKFYDRVANSFERDRRTSMYTAHSRWTDLYVVEGEREMERFAEVVKNSAEYFADLKEVKVTIDKGYTP